MEWYVTYQDFNSQKFKRVNILKYYEDFIKKLKKKVNSYYEFSEELRREMAYHYRSKCEWEIVLKRENGRLYMLSWPPREGEVGVDITEDQLFDWSGFFDKIIENRVSKTECKIDVYDQLFYQFDEFAIYCFLYPHKYQRQAERDKLLRMYVEAIS